ncbi:uncharacterized protein LOC118268337 [Spodoptera frugiperda]|uniref:Odorant receptor n=1 Tax=Spodoptera frugiperda TaxID=7108 RepID=A0A9R0EAG4_SPOFR
MGLIKNLCLKLSYTKAIDRSSGRLETMFFENYYRIAYMTGMSTADDNIGYLVYSNAVKLMIVLLVLGVVWYGFMETTSFDEFAGNLNVSLLQFITFYRYRNMLAHEKFYNELASSMESPYFDISTEQRKKLVEFWSRTNVKYLKLLMGLGNCTLLAWFIFPLVDDIEYNLIVGLYLPFFYKSPSMYPLAYMLSVIFFFYISQFVMVTDLKMQTHLIHVLCQFSVLADCFENMIPDCTAGLEGVPRNHLMYNNHFAAKYTERLGNLVKQHKILLGHAMNLRDTLSGPLLGQLAASGVLICFIGYQATATIGQSVVACMTSFLFLAYNLFDFYMICRWCQEITNQSANVGEAIYCSGWECGVSKLPGVRSTIMFVIARANKPLVLTAGGMYDLSLTSYTSLVKTSYSALTVLLRFRHD